MELRPRSLRCGPASSGYDRPTLWDDHIRKILGLLLPNGLGIRSSSLPTSIQKLRPDFDFLLRNVCLFRGEEKSPTNSDDPKAELSDKLIWIYSLAPYVFGEPIAGLRGIHVGTHSYPFIQAYHAVGAEVTLSVICAPQRPSAKPYVEDLAASNLRLQLSEDLLWLNRPR
jgi:hypothetical protein